MWLASAYSRHSLTTGHSAQIFWARNTPTPSEGKKTFGGSPTQRARAIQPVLGNLDGIVAVSIESKYVTRRLKAP